jgi:hypothetical protein
VPKLHAGVPGDHLRRGTAIAQSGIGHGFTTRARRIAWSRGRRRGATEARCYEGGGSGGTKPWDSSGTGKGGGDPASVTPGGATGVGGAGCGTPEDALATGGCGGAPAGDPSSGGGSGGAGGDVLCRLSTWRCTACPALSAAFFKSSRKPISMPLVDASCFAQHMRWRQPTGIEAIADTHLRSPWLQLPPNRRSSITQPAEVANLVEFRTSPPTDNTFSTGRCPQLHVTADRSHSR